MGGALFFITFVSWPEKTTNPSTNSVFLIYIPLNIMFSESKEIGWVELSPKLKFPSNLYKYGLGFSQVRVPYKAYQILVS